VDLFFGLQAQSPENGSFPGFGWRLSGIFGRKGANAGLQRLSTIRKARIWRAFFVKKRKFSQNRNGWLAAQYWSHPSPGKFPANREFYREDRALRVFQEETGIEKRTATAFSCEIPCRN
jgi:hypothetical protein